MPIWLVQSESTAYLAVYGAHHQAYLSPRYRMDRFLYLHPYRYRFVFLSLGPIRSARYPAYQRKIHSFGDSNSSSAICSLSKYVVASVSLCTFRPIP
ncbi:hypothetical protein XELAEV_18045324mg [Xenopus laevis]|uniref:Uncharacterized protein n=1 Tax=Xenopus laevis TaxID=8355 RepID=A0A974C0E1_XENLA|nr:hypothetical protein XELAEV_18045324mg [Xenopus laevis]